MATRPPRWRVRNNIDLIFGQRGINLPERRLRRITRRVWRGTMTYQDVRALGNQIQRRQEINRPTSPTRQERREREAQVREDARDVMAAQLREWGFEGSRTDAGTPLGELMQLMRTGQEEAWNESRLFQEMRKTNAWRKRFAGMQRRVENGFNAISVADYLNYEDEYADLLADAGLPDDLFDGPEDIETLIANNVSLRRVAKRIEDAFMVVNSAPGEVREEMARLYGAGHDGALAAYFLDPDRSWQKIQTQVRAAQISGMAKVSGYDETGLELGTAERLARMGVDQGAALSGMSDLARQSELFKPLLGRGKTFSQGDQLALQFEQDANLKEQLERVREERLAEFGGGGGAVAQQSGIIGLGSSDS